MGDVEGKANWKEERVELSWFVDSETGEKVLVDVHKKLVLGRWVVQEICPLCGRKRGS